MFTVLVTVLRLFPTCVPVERVQHYRPLLRLFGSVAGEAASVVSEARQSSRRLDTARSQRPAFPEVSQTGVGGHVTKEVPNVMAGAARPTGLRVDGRERLNYATTEHRFYLAWGGYLRLGVLPSGLKLV